MIRCASLRPGTTSLLRQVVDALGEGGELVGERPRVGLVGQEQVEHRGGLEVAHVAPAVGHGAVGDLEEGFQQRRFGAAHRRPGCSRSMIVIWSERSSRRPMSRNRQPWPRVMLSATRPPKAARLMTVRSRTRGARSVGDAPTARHREAVGTPCVAAVAIPGESGDFELEAAEDPPHVGREPVADLGRDPVQAVDRCGQAAGTARDRRWIAKQLAFQGREPAVASPRRGIRDRSASSC